MHRGREIRNPGQRGAGGDDGTEREARRRIGGGSLRGSRVVVSRVPVPGGGGEGDHRGGRSERILLQARVSGDSRRGGGEGKRRRLRRGGYTGRLCSRPDASTQGNGGPGPGCVRGREGGRGDLPRRVDAGFGGRGAGKEGDLLLRHQGRPGERGGPVRR